jgi:hypothetical protein
MKLLITSLALALASPTASAAAPEATAPAAEAADSTASWSSRLELGRRFVAITVSTDEYAAAMLVSADEMASALVAEYEDDPRQESVSLAMDEMRTRTEAKVRAIVPLLFEAWAQAYARQFSEDELRQLIAFAESPVGKQYLSGFGFLEQDPAVAAAQEAVWSAMSEMMEAVGKEFCTRQADMQLALGEGEPCPYADDSVTRRG